MIIPRDKAERHALLDLVLRTVIPLQIRELRSERKWTQADLASRSGLPQPTIARLEKVGAPLPSIKTLQKIASAFDVGLLVKFSSWSEFLEFASPYENELRP